MYAKFHAYFSSKKCFIIGNAKYKKNVRTSDAFHWLYFSILKLILVIVCGSCKVFKMVCIFRLLTGSN